MKLLTRKKQDMLLKAIAANEILMHYILKYTKMNKETTSAYGQIITNDCDMACLIDGINGTLKVFETISKEAEDSGDFVEPEAVEMCPHCMSENVFPDYDTKKDGYKVRCQHCGEEIMLCDECQHSDDYRPCDWRETSTGGKCYRGTTTLRGASE